MALSLCVCVVCLCGGMGIGRIGAVLCAYTSTPPHQDRSECKQKNSAVIGTHTHTPFHSLTPTNPNTPTHATTATTADLSSAPSAAPKPAAGPAYHALYTLPPSSARTAQRQATLDAFLAFLPTQPQPHPHPSSLSGEEEEMGMGIDMGATMHTLVVTDGGGRRHYGFLQRAGAGGDVRGGVFCLCVYIFIYHI